MLPGSTFFLHVETLQNLSANSEEKQSLSHEIIQWLNVSSIRGQGPWWKNIGLFRSRH